MHISTCWEKNIKLNIKNQPISPIHWSIRLAFVNCEGGSRRNLKNLSNPMFSLERLLECIELLNSWNPWEPIEDSLPSKSYGA